MTKKTVRGIIAAVTAFILFAAPIAAADAEELATASQSGYTGWVYQNGERYWFDSGTMARSKEVYDPNSDAWYWFDADGTMAHDKDVYLSSEDK